MTFPIFVCRKSGKVRITAVTGCFLLQRHFVIDAGIVSAQRTKLIITPIYPVPGTGQADMTFFPAAHHFVLVREQFRRNVCILLLLECAFSFFRTG